MIEDPHDSGPPRPSRLDRGGPAWVRIPRPPLVTRTVFLLVRLCFWGLISDLHSRRSRIALMPPRRQPRAASSAPQDFESLPSRFAAVGIRLVYVGAFPSSKLDGASFLLNNDSGMLVVALCGRGKRRDKVLFTLLHEIAHVVKGHVLANGMVLDEDDASDKEEQQPNKCASEWALPADLDAVPLVIRREWVDGQAARLGVHPLVVVGQLQYRKKLDWRSALVRDAAILTVALETWGANASEGRARPRSARLRRTRSAPLSSQISQLERWSESAKAHRSALLGYRAALPNAENASVRGLNGPWLPVSRTRTFRKAV